MSRDRLPGLPVEAERALLAKLEAHSRRIAALEGPQPVQPPLITADFDAREWQTLFLSAGASGIRGLLPAPRPQNRGATIRLVTTNNNPVRLSCPGGLVNGVPVLTHDVAGAYEAVCDGSAGWWLESLEIGAHLAGTGLTVNQDGTLSPRQRPRHALIYDYFVSGNTTSGSIGALGWNLLGIGTPSVLRNNATVMGSSGRIELTTSAALNDRAVLCLGETETRDILPPRDLTLMQAVCSQDGTLTSKRFFFGFMSTLASEPSVAVDCLGVYFDSAVSANYLLIARAASVGLPVNTGVAVPSSTSELITIQRIADDNYEFRLGNALLGAITSDVADTTATNVGFRVETLTAAARHTNVGYFGLEAVAGNAYDDDNFLQG